MEENKKKSLPLRILFKLMIAVASLVGIAAGWIAYSALNRVSPLKFIPQGYSAIIHTDSLYDAVEPLVGLKAVETVLAEDTLSSAREPLMAARAFVNDSDAMIAFLLKIRVDAALYLEQETSFIAVADLGWRSFATRLATLFPGFIKVENLSWTNGYFEYKTEDSSIYIKTFKNLAIASLSKDMLLKSVSQSETRPVTEPETKEIDKAKTKDFKIIVPSAKITQMDFLKDYCSENTLKILGEDSLSTLLFTITNEDINLTVNVPFVKEECTTQISETLTRKSTIPKIRGFLPSDTQYYTLINLCSLKEMKEVFFPFLQKTTDIESTWKKTDRLTRSMFSLTLEELLFSWTGNEITVFGIEGSSDPVFALQVKDEAQRAKVFDILDDSILINTNTNLIVNGMRLPCLELPGYLSSFLSIFGVTLPRPFYLVQNGYIYFSMSPQNLSSIYTQNNRQYTVTRSYNWKSVSSTARANSSVELYYNLKRSLPFFLDNTSIISKVLKLYGIGRYDYEVKENCIEVALYASAVEHDESRQLVGFPKQTGKISSYTLIADNKKNPENIYWIENGKTIKALDLNSLVQKEITFDEECHIASTEGKSGKNNKLWVSTDSGEIYLLNKDLECAQGFPVSTGLEFTAPGTAYMGNYAVPAAGGYLILMDSKGNYEEIYITEDANIKSAPSVFNNNLVLYNRGFEGELYLLKGNECVNNSSPMTVDGIGFGSPCISSENGKIYVAFITQSGTFYLFEDGKLMDGFPIETDGVFFTPAVCLKGEFYALSEDALVYKILKDGTYSTVKLPGITSAKEGFISTVEYENWTGIYACGDSNILYGFNPQMELLMSFPVAGRGVPVFADVNKDKNTNCLVLSISRELNSWRLK